MARTSRADPATCPTCCKRTCSCKHNTSSTTWPCRWSCVRRHPAGARARASELFEVFGLEGTEQRWPSELSGGMRSAPPFCAATSSRGSACCSTSRSRPSTPLRRRTCTRGFSNVVEQVGTTGAALSCTVESTGDRTGGRRVRDARQSPAWRAHARGGLRAHRLAPRADRSSFTLTEAFLLHEAARARAVGPKGRGVAARHQNETK